MVKLREFTADIIKRLSPLYDESEARWLVRTMLESLTGWTRTDILLKADSEVSPRLQSRVETVVKRLLNHEPIQYILGETYWHGLTLKVSPSVLIPRVETSELVDLIEDANKGSDLNVLDLCTGSGCIAIALARDLPFAHVTAIDLSASALAVAGENAARCKTAIDFLKADVLAPLDIPSDSQDIIVSNPPYIDESEARGMDANVLDYEPHMALFVPDDDPLKFYRAISREAIRIARPRGRLYFEINPLHVISLTQLLARDDWQDITTHRDLQGKQRFISASKPGN